MLFPNLGLTNMVLRLVVYDLAPQFVTFNSITSLLGLGVFHCAVEMWCPEWQLEVSKGQKGVYMVRTPTKMSRHVFRSKVDVGLVWSTPAQVLQVLKTLSTTMGPYDMLRNNCVHFCQAFAQQLCGLKLPLAPTFHADIGQRIARVTDVVASTATFVMDILDQYWEGFEAVSDAGSSSVGSPMSSVSSEVVLISPVRSPARDIAIQADRQRRHTAPPIMQTVPQQRMPPPRIVVQTPQKHTPHSLQVATEPRPMQQQTPTRPIRTPQQAETDPMARDRSRTRGPDGRYQANPEVAPLTNAQRQALFRQRLRDASFAQ